MSANPSLDPSQPLRFQRPVLPSSDRIESYLERSRSARWFSNDGPCSLLFAERVAERVGAHCVPVASGTMGLLAAVSAVLEDERSPGRCQAIVPSFTFPATAQAALWNGLQPRLIDVAPGHWHLDPDMLEEELERGRGAVAVVIAVSSFGTPPPPLVRERWERACRAADVPLVVDSAAGFGARAGDGLAVGAQGDVEVVSFHATKPFAIGEGGAVLTTDPAIRDRVRLAVNFGLDAQRRVSMPWALNGKMSELHAATALAVLDEFDDVLRHRTEAARFIADRARATVDWQQGSELSTWQFVPVAFESRAARDAARRRCAGSLETRTYYEPLHRMEPLSSWTACPSGLTVTDDLAERVLCLPMSNDITEAELRLVAEPLRP